MISRTRGALAVPVIFASLAAAAFVLAARAQQTFYYWGCLYCYERTSVTFARDECRDIPHDTVGNTLCREDDFGLQRFCTAYGESCYGVTVSGGGGGTGGGGGGGSADTCVVPGGAACPAWCQSCERPAV